MNRKKEIKKGKKMLAEKKERKRLKKEKSENKGEHFKKRRNI